MVDTGWKHPKTISESKDGVNPGRACYSWKKMDNIKKDDDSYCDISPWSRSGVDSTHYSPYLYAYNYGFNLPKDATVDKITLFVKIQQLTHPLPKWERKVGKKVRYSASKFSSLKLKQGASTKGAGDGTNFASKCGSQMLPYKKWSTEAQTTFTGTPKEWGITSKDVVSIINSGNFGVVLQVVGTIRWAWNNPGIALMKMKVDYTVPVLDTTKPVESTFTKITVTCDGHEVAFTDNVSGVLGDLTYNNPNSFKIVNFNFYHKGLAGETPILIFESGSLWMGANGSSRSKGVAVASKYTMASVQCGSDDTVKVYTQSLAVFPGVLLGEQTVKYKLNDVVYTLKFNVVDTSLSDSDRAKFMNMNQQCMIKNCLFYNNHAVGVGGANCVTSEFYHGEGNIFGVGGNVNKADNKYNDSVEACPNTCWLGKCVNK